MSKSTNIASLPNAPAFSARGTALQSVSDQTFTKVAFNTEEFDTASCYDHVTNYRFTPNIAGYYHLRATINAAASATGGVWILLYKNGSTFKSGQYLANNNSAPNFSVEALVHANGTTDYFEIFCWHNAGTSLNMGSASANLTFSGHLARPA